MGISYSVSVLTSPHSEAAQQLAEEFNWPKDQNDADVLLLWHEGQLSVRIQDDSELASFKPTSFDVGQITIGDHKQPLARACGLHKQDMRILDVCAGTGTDAFILNRLGATVHSCENNAVIFVLLRDAFQRSGSPARWTISHEDSRDQLRSANIDCIYCDPMFPPTTKRRGAERKEMRILHYLNQSHLDGDALIQTMAQTRVQRLVLKRPLRAAVQAFEHRSLQNQIKCKGFRFDIYDLQ